MTPLVQGISQFKDDGAYAYNTAIFSKNPASGQGHHRGRASGPKIAPKRSLFFPFDAIPLAGIALFLPGAVSA
jgi:hypothetical protein